MTFSLADIRLARVDVDVPAASSTATSPRCRVEAAGISNSNALGPVTPGHED